MFELLAVIILTVALAIYLNHRWVKSLNELIEQLYGRRDNEVSNRKFEKLQRAINFAINRQQNQDAEDVQRLSRELEELRQELGHQKSDTDDQFERLEAAQQEVEEDKLQLKATSELVEYALKRFISSLNRGDDSATLHTHADAVSFLVSRHDRDPHRGKEHLVNLIDSTLDMLTPLLNHRGHRFHVRVFEDCPREVEINTTHFRRVLHGLIITQLTPENTDIRIRVNFGADKLTFNFSNEFKANLTLGLDDLMSAHGVTWMNNELQFPASQPHIIEEHPEETGLTALVVADHEYERQSLTWRLQALGVTCTNDFNSGHIDMCLVSDENSDAFLSIRSHLDETTFIGLLNSKVVINRPYWSRLPDPISQIALQQMVDHIGHTKDESRQLHTLIVDDSVANARLLSLQLSELGHTFDDASSGKEALELIGQNTYQIVFMDIQMPDMNGVEATKRIREQGMNMPVFGLTAHATSQEKEAYRMAGMDDVLIKPVRLESLKSLLRKQGRLTPKPPIAAPANQNLVVFDKELALRNANHRPELASELLTILMQSLPEDHQAILASSNDNQELRKTVHKLHGAVRYCGVPRLGRAIEKLESALKQGDEEQIPILLNLLAGEITSLEHWHRENPDPFLQTLAQY